MSKINRDYEELMSLLDTVPGVREHLNSIEVQTGIQLLKRRIELQITQQELSLKTGLPLQVIDGYELGLQPIDNVQLNKIKTCLDLEI